MRRDARSGSRADRSPAPSAREGPALRTTRAGRRRRRPGPIAAALSTAAGLLVLSAAPPRAEPAGDPPAREDTVEIAAAAVAELRERLGAALRAALAEGPEHAIGVCRAEAPAIAAGLTREGVSVGRTSHRLRNEANAPEPWMQPLLAELREREPEPGASLTVDLGARGLGYVEPIYLQPPCTTCHGEHVDPALLETLRALYPRDEAVGFRVGELRGLFWAVVARDAAPDRVDEVSGPITWGALSGVRRVGGLWISGQPDLTALRAARDAGVALVIDLREADEHDFDEASAAARLGMRYRRIPVPRAAPFPAGAFARIDALVAQNPGAPILVHCASGNRAAGWLATHLVRAHGRPLEDALAVGREAGITSDAIAEKVVRFLEAHPRAAP